MSAFIVFIPLVLPRLSLVHATSFNRIAPDRVLPIYTSAAPYYAIAKSRESLLNSMIEKRRKGSLQMPRNQSVGNDVASLELLCRVEQEGDLHSLKYALVDEWEESKVYLNISCLA